MPSAAMIFAAGFGTRMRPLTDTQPKPMIPVADRPLIDYALDLTLDTKLKKTIVNLHYFPDQIIKHLSDHENVHTIIEPEILETGGGLKNALPLLGNDPVFTLNSDAVWTGLNPLQALQDAWNPKTMDALLVLIPTANAQEHRGKGDFQLDSDGRINRRGSAPSAPYVYSGAQIIKTHGLNHITESAFSLNVLWNDMLSKKRVFGIVHNGGWVDVGRPEGIKIAEQELARNV